MTATDNALIVVETLTPATVFGDGGVDDILAKLRKAADEAANDLDISTEIGRKQIASVAYKVARSKTALDGLGKDLVADLKARAGRIDAERRRLWEGCEAIQNDIRRPLTEWETVEKDRVTAHEQAITTIEAVAIFMELEPTAAAIRSRMETLKTLADDGRDWQEFRERARKSALATHGALAQMLEIAEARERAAAQAEQKRIEEAERLRKEREDRIAQEAAERAKREAEQVAQAEQRRLEAEKKAAEDRQRAAEEATRRAEQEAIAAKERAERAAKETEERLRREAEERQAAEAAEVVRREANKAHRTKINREIVAALVASGLTQDVAKSVVVLIAKKTIPHVAISY